MKETAKHKSNICLSGKGSTYTGMSDTSREQESQEEWDDLKVVLVGSLNTVESWLLV